MQVDCASNLFCLFSSIFLHLSPISILKSLFLVDGSDEASLSALKASSDLDIAADLLATAEAEDDIDAAEKRVEDALEALLDAEIRGNEDEEEGDSVRKLLSLCNAVIYVKKTEPLI